MGHVKDIKGEKFGRLTVLERVENTNDGTARWMCKCDCGNTHVVIGTQLRNGKIKSCGCLNLDNHSTHRLSNTRLYHIYHQMIKRCYNPKNPAYKNYGERGIVVCEEWKNDIKSFFNWALSNGYNDALTLDRIDNNDLYSPFNCRWVSEKVQANNRRSNRIIKYKGDKYTLMQLSELSGISYSTLKARLNLGWSVEDAINIRPVKGRNQYNNI